VEYITKVFICGFVKKENFVCERKVVTRKSPTWQRFFYIQSFINMAQFEVNN
jgi:hypothetical protein